ncbi:hypothetical protein Dimus_010506, partial [Dionaea muscipula]
SGSGSSKVEFPGVFGCEDYGDCGGVAMGIDGEGVDVEDEGRLRLCEGLFMGFGPPVLFVVDIGGNRIVGYCL